MADSDVVKALRDMKLQFPEGEITNFFPDKGYGFITNSKGERIFFFLPEVDTMGYRVRDIRKGLRVGYDVSLTSKGRRISRMKILTGH
ncbi:MAG: cold shock domain-containing protein [Acidobacteriota bacterium]